MTSDRPYRAAISSDEALAKLRAGMRTQFDPGVVEAFCELAAQTPSQLARAA